MPQLDTSTFSSQLFWLGVCFLVLYLILSYLVVPKIARVLQTREDTLEEKINKASSYREQAESLLREYEEILANARIKAHERSRSMTHSISSEIAHKQKDFLGKINDRLHLEEQSLYKIRLKERNDVKFLAADVAGVILKKLTGRTYQRDELLLEGKVI